MTPAALGVRLAATGVAVVRMHTTKTTRGTNNRLLTMSQVCDQLGISRSTFYDWRQARKAPACIVLPNAQIRVRQDDLDAWVNAHEDNRR